MKILAVIWLVFCVSLLTLEKAVSLPSSAVLSDVQPVEGEQEALFEDFGLLEAFAEVPDAFAAAVAVGNDYQTGYKQPFLSVPFLPPRSSV